MCHNTITSSTYSDWCLNLFDQVQNGIDDAFHGGFEEFCYLGSGRMSFSELRFLKARRSNLPGKFQLTIPNITQRIVIPRSSEFYILRCRVIVKSDLRRLVEATDNVVKIFIEVRVLEIILSPTNIHMRVSDIECVRAHHQETLWPER